MRRERTLVELRFPAADKASILPLLTQQDCHTAELEALSLKLKQRDHAIAIALAEAGDYAAALEKLRAVIVRYPEDQELRLKFRTLHTLHALARLKHAAVLFETGNADQARKALNEASEADPQNADIKAAIARMSADYLAGRIRAQARLGRYADATPDLQAWFQSNATPAASLAEFRWERQRDVFLAWGLRVAELLAVALIVGWLVARLWRRYRSPTLLILESFESGELAPGFGQALQATFISLGKGSSRAAAAVLGVTRPLQSTPLPAEIANVLPPSVSWLQALPTLLDRISPRRTKTVRGVLHKDSERGVGVTIQISNGGEDHLSETFWARQYLGPKSVSTPTADTHYALAEYVAIWLIFTLSGDDFKLLGAHNWKSYAFFRAGVLAEERQDRNLAKAMYLRALGFDAKLQAARLNLALLSGEAERQLVFNLLESATGADRDDATRYQARYVLASRKYDGDADDRPALEEIKALLKDIKDTCYEYRFIALERELAECLQDAPPPPREAARERSDRDEELHSYLRFIVPIAKAMWAALILTRDSRDRCALEAIDEIARIDYSPRVYFNLACAYSLSTRGASEDAEKLDLFQRSLKCIQLALWMNAAIGAKAKTDRSLHDLRTSSLVLQNKTVAALFADILELYLPKPAPSTARAGRFVPNW